MQAVNVCGLTTWRLLSWLAVCSDRSAQRVPACSALHGCIEIAQRCHIAGMDRHTLPRVKPSAAGCVWSGSAIRRICSALVALWCMVCAALSVCARLAWPVVCCVAVVLCMCGRALYVGAHGAMRGGIIARVMACVVLRVFIVHLHAGYASGVIRGYTLPRPVNPTTTRTNKRGVERGVMGVE